MIEELLTYNYELNGVFIDKLEETGLDSPDALRFMSHILNGQLLWNARIDGQKSPVGVWDLHSFTEMREYNQRGYRDSLRIISEKGLEYQLAYTNTKGFTFDNTVFEIQMQLVNHGTHHRGQIALLLRQNDIQPPIGDYIFWKRNN